MNCELRIEVRVGFRVGFKVFIMYLVECEALGI